MNIFSRSLNKQLSELKCQNDNIFMKTNSGKYMILQNRHVPISGLYFMDINLSFDLV